MPKAETVAELVNIYVGMVAVLYPEITTAGRACKSVADLTKCHAHDVVIAESVVCAGAGVALRTDVDRGIGSGSGSTELVACITKQLTLRDTARQVGGGGSRHGVEIGADAGLDPCLAIRLITDVVSYRAVQHGGGCKLGYRFGRFVAEIDTDEEDFLLGARPTGGL